MNTLYAADTAAWRDWLEQNGTTEQSVWLVIQHKDSSTPSVGYHEGDRARVVFRLDRQQGAQERQEQLSDALHPAQAEEHLGALEPRPGATNDRRRPDATGRPGADRPRQAHRPLGHALTAAWHPYQPF